MNQPQQKKQQPQISKDSLVEQLRNLSSGVGKTVTHDLVGGVAQDALSSLFGAPRNPNSSRSGSLSPGQSVNLAPEPPAPDDPFDAFPQRMPNERLPFPFRRPKPEYKPQYSPEMIARLRQQESEVQHKIEEIRVELKQLVAEIRSVDKEIQKAVNEQLVDPGEYHLNFFDRLKAVLKLMLIEMRQSKNWLETSKSKKKQKGYWAQYKKKGTSFGLSNERNVATQVG